MILNPSKKVLNIFPAKFLARFLGPSLLVASLHANGAAARGEAFKETIEKAQGLVLSKNRNKAIELLVSSIQREVKKSNNIPPELAKTLSQVATTFISDKAQQLYELALTSALTEPQSAQVKLQDAIKIEEDNLEMIITSHRLQLAQKNCSKTLQEAKILKERIPFLESIDLLLAQAAVCQGQFEEYKAAATAATHGDPELKVFWDNLKLEYLFRSGHIPESAELGQSILSENPNFPETYYWLWRIAKDQSKTQVEWAGKYVEACKSLSPRLSRTYIQEPFLCKKIPEIEAQTKL